MLCSLVLSTALWLGNALTPLSILPSPANQSGFEHPAAERWLPPRRDPGRRGPGSDPAQISQPYLHVLPGNLLHHLSNTVTPSL